MRAGLLTAVTVGVLSLGSIAQADVVHDWNIEALRVTFPAGPPQGRVLAIMHVAMSDAINVVTGEYETYAASAVNVPPGTSSTAAGAAAAHHVLVTLFPGSPFTGNWNTALTNSLAGIPQPARDNGVAVGVAVADLILGLRQFDGFSTPTSYTPGSGAGIWVPTEPGFAAALLPGFGNVLPFALRSAYQFRPPGPTALSSEEYAADLNEVQTVGSLNGEALGFRSAEQSAIARFWLGNSIPIFQGIARSVSQAHPLSESANARFFALLSIAGVDAYIATWDAKYTYNFWRPVTAIRNADDDENPATFGDPNWRPFADSFPGPGTPPFPEYVSGHTAYTRAFVHVLEEVFGRGNVPFVANNPNPAIPSNERNRLYDNFRQLSTEMIEARVLAGIHFRTSDRDGDRLGRQVAQFAITHVLRPTHGN